MPSRPATRGLLCRAIERQRRTVSRVIPKFDLASIWKIQCKFMQTIGIAAFTLASHDSTYFHERPRQGHSCTKRPTCCRSTCNAAVIIVVAKRYGLLGRTLSLCIDVLACRPNLAAVAKHQRRFKAPAAANSSNGNIEIERSVAQIYGPKFSRHVTTER